MGDAELGPIPSEGDSCQSALVREKRENGGASYVIPFMTLKEEKLSGCLPREVLGTRDLNQGIEATKSQDIVDGKTSLVVGLSSHEHRGSG